MQNSKSYNTKHPRIEIGIYSEEKEVPQYAYGQASGCDLRTRIKEPVTLEPMEVKLFPTGVYLEIPPGYEGQIRPRSGKALKKGLTLPNAPATIDADYRGEIMVACINLSKWAIEVEPGECIAQLIFAPVVQAKFIQLESPSALQPTLRAGQGFGSSGS